MLMKRIKTEAMHFICCVIMILLRTRLLAAKGKMRQPGKRTGVEDEGGGGGIIEEIVAAITSSTCSVCIFRLFNVLENTD
jgi:hypothetical protein